MDLMTVVMRHVQYGKERRLNLVKVEDRANTKQVALILKGISNIMNKLETLSIGQWKKCGDGQDM